MWYLHICNWEKNLPGDVRTTGRGRGLFFDEVVRKGCVMTSELRPER